MNNYLVRNQELRFNKACLSLERAKGARDVLKSELLGIDNQIKDVRGKIDLYDRCLKLLESVSSVVRKQVIGRIESIVTLALQHVFGPEYTFSLIEETKNDVPAIYFSVSSPGPDDSVVTGDPRNMEGGGLSDLVGLALRIALLELYQPFIEGPLILDEPCAKLDADRQPKLAEFLRLYSEKQGRQIILITHSQAFVDVASQRLHVALGAGKVSQVVDFGAEGEWNLGE